jgi:hypothetical protein
VNKKPRPFKAYIKEIRTFGRDAGEVFIMTDGFNEVNGKLTEECKKMIMDEYPSTCFSNLPRNID